MMSMSMKTVCVDAFDEAKRKAKYGHRNWVVWPNKDGLYAHHALMTAESIKTAMLATGTKGRFFMVTANDGHFWNIRWRQAVVMLSNAKNGY